VFPNVSVQDCIRDIFSKFIITLHIRIKMTNFNWSIILKGKSYISLTSNRVNQCMEIGLLCERIHVDNYVIFVFRGWRV